MKQVAQEYIDGIGEGRAAFKLYGMEDAQERLAGLERLCKQFDASNPVGQMMRGERDFWRNKLRNA